MEADDSLRQTRKQSAEGKYEDPAWKGKLHQLCCIIAKDFVAKNSHSARVLLCSPVLPVGTPTSTHRLNSDSNLAVGVNVGVCGCLHDASYTGITSSHSTTLNRRTKMEVYLYESRRLLNLCYFLKSRNIIVIHFTFFHHRLICVVTSCIYC